MTEARELRRRLYESTFLGSDAVAAVVAELVTSFGAELALAELCNAGASSTLVANAVEPHVERLTAARPGGAEVNRPTPPASPETLTGLDAARYWGKRGKGEG